MLDAFDEIEDDAGRQGDRESSRLAEVHERAMLRFDSVALPQAEMRAQSLGARRFISVPGAMWEDKWGLLYQNMPWPEVDKITPQIEKIEQDYRENRMTVDFVAAGGDSDDDTAETLDGMHRADSYEFGADEARDNGFMEALGGGFGAWMLGTEYEDALDPSNDAMRVVPGYPIVDADQSVYFDGASRRYDKADAEWAFLVVAEPRISAEQKYAGAVPSWPLVNFRYQYDWFRPDVVRIATYWEVETVPDVRVLLTQRESGEEQRFYKSDVDQRDIADLIAQGWERKDRKIERKRVRKYIMTGAEVVKDCGYIAGDSIPIVPVYYKRYFVDNMERWQGLVQKKMDRQRIYNTMVARLVEQDSLTPREVPIVAAEQVNATIADEWARSNIDRHPFLRLLPLRNEDGSIANAGPIGTLKPPDLPPARATLLQIMGQELEPENDNAEQVKANVSADAMDIAAQRVDAKSGIPLDNMRKSVRREGEIYLPMARDTYWQPGRKVETLSMDGKSGQATLGEPRLTPDGLYRMVNDLQRGRYKVVADVQEATKTRQQKTVRQCLASAEVAIAAQDMELAQAFILTAAMNQDGEGMDQLHEWMRRRALGLGLVEPTPEEEQAIQQAQQNQTPDPAASVLQSQAELNSAAAQEKAASAELKRAQAEAVGGPVQQPDAPSGLGAPGLIAELNSRLASADLDRAKAAHLRADITDKRIRTGHEIDMARRDAANGGQ